MTAAIGPPLLHLVVIAKAPVAGQVKTRLCPPLTAQQAAAMASAALADTLATVAATPAATRTLVLDGDRDAVELPAGFTVLPQRGEHLGERLQMAFLDCFAACGAATDPGRVQPGHAVLLVGMDTPQVRRHHLEDAAERLAHNDAVLGPAVDGGFWALGLRQPWPAQALRDVVMSTASSGADTLAALKAWPARVATCALLRDVDTGHDAAAVAALAPGTRFAAAWRAVAGPAPA